MKICIDYDVHPDGGGIQVVYADQCEKRLDSEASLRLLVGRRIVGAQYDSSNTRIILELEDAVV